MSSNLATQTVAGSPDDSISPLAGKPAPKEMLVDLARLETGLLRSQARPAGSQPTG